MRLPVPRWKSFLASLGLRFRRRSHRAAHHSAAGAPTGGFRHSAAGALTGGFRRHSAAGAPTGGFRRRRNAIAHPESLEPRRLLAVTTSFVDGALVITGDANDNTLIVSTNQSGELTLQQAGGSPVVIPYALTSNTVSITINAGAGNDTIDLRALDPAVFEVLGQNALTVDGGDGDDIILGGPGNESLTGGAGDDTIDGGLGTDTLTGGTGDDTYQLGEGTGEADAKTIVETLDGDTDTIAYSGDQAPFELQIGSSTVVAGTGYGVFTLTLSGSTAPTLAMNELGYLRIDEASGFAAGSQFDIHQGMVVLTADAGTSTASNLSITVDQGGDLNIRTTQHLAGLTLENGQVYVSGRSVILTTALSVNEADSILDLGAGAIILDYTGTSPASAIRTDIISGANVTADVWWTGFGITSSRARHSGGLTAVGMMDNYLGGYGPFYEDFLGHPVDTTTIIIRHTYAGDAEINGSIDGTDYALLDNGYIFQTPIDWLNGDFNYDDAIDGTDYSIIDNSLLFQGPTADELPTIELDEDAPPGTIETAHFWSDPLDSPLTFALHSNTNAGLFQSLSIHATTGLVSYTLTANASGTAEIEIEATNAEGLSRVSGPLTIEVAAINDAPVLAATPTLPGGSPLLQLSNGDIYVDLYDPVYGASSYNVIFNVSASDVDIPGGGLTFTLVDAPSGATISTTSSTTAQVSWTVTQAMGTVTEPFTVRAADGSGSGSLYSQRKYYVSSGTGFGSSPGSGTTAAVARDDRYFTAAGQALNVSAGDGVLANDYNHGSAAIGNVTLVSGPSHAAIGGFTLNSDGSFSYQAEEEFYGIDSFVYQTASGGYGTVSINNLLVAEVNDPDDHLVRRYTVDPENSTQEIDFVTAEGELRSVLVRAPDDDESPYQWGVDFGGTVESGDGKVEVTFGRTGPYEIAVTRVASGVEHTTWSQLLIDADADEAFNKRHLPERHYHSGLEDWFHRGQERKGDLNLISGSSGDLKRYRATLGSVGATGTVVKDLDDAIRQIVSYGSASGPGFTVYIVGHANDGFQRIGAGEFPDGPDKELSAESPSDTEADNRAHVRNREKFLSACVYAGVGKVIFGGCSVAKTEFGRAFLQDMADASGITFEAFTDTVRRQETGKFFITEKVPHIWVATPNNDD